VRNTTHSTHTPNLLKTDHIKPSHTIHIPKILLAPCSSALQQAFPSAINNKKSPFFESTQANTTKKKKNTYTVPLAIYATLLQIKKA